jgi:hypothetical protein
MLSPKYKFDPQNITKIWIVSPKYNQNMNLAPKYNQNMNFILKI